MKKLILVLSAATVLAGTTTLYAGDTLDKPGKFDEEEILATQRLGTQYDSIVVRDYSTKGAELSNIDDEEKKYLDQDKADIVKALTSSTVKHLQEKKLFKHVSENGTAKGKALILQGKIVKFNGGVGAAKYFLGFMAPKSTKTNISIEAELVDAATGKPLAKIKDVRSGGEGNTLGSSNMTKAFKVQAEDEGEELAEFIEALY